MLWLYKLPYKVGLFSAVSLGLVSIPLVFHLGFAEWFNEEFVTFEKYGEGEADTWLEVGSWTWNWMEPVSCVGEKQGERGKGPFPRPSLTTAARRKPQP